MKAVVKHLPNGLTVVLRQTRSAPVVALQMWIGVGSADEAKGEEGLAHVLEHMLFKGTKRRKVGEIARDVERAGGHVNAWTSHDETVFFITLASRYWKQGLDILADAVQHSSLDAGELGRELAVIREEIRMGEDSPDRVVIQNLFKTSFRRHPYGRPVIGFDRTVKGFTQKSVVDFYHHWYVPSNMVLVVVGDFDNKVMLEEVRGAFVNFNRSDTLARTMRHPEPNQRKTRIVHDVKPISEAHLAIGFPIPGIKHEDIPALDLLATILGQGASSRLETIIRRKLSLVSGIRALSYTPCDSGLFSVFATTPTHNLEKAMRAIFSELNRVTDDLITPAEIEKGLVLLESDKVYSEETVDGIARKTGFYALHTGDVEFEDRYLAALTNKDPGDLIEVARRYITPSTANVAAIIPDPSRSSPERRVSWILGRGTKKKVDDKKLKTLLHAQVETPYKTRKRHGPGVTDKDETVVCELSSGDVLLVRRDSSSKLVAARAAFLGGVRHERPSDSGIFALLSNTITRGTDSLSAEDVAGTMDKLACSIGGFAGRNTIGIYGEFLKSNFTSGFSLMADCLRRPAFSKEEVEREKELLMEDIRASKDNPNHEVFKLFFRALFGKHPYSRPVRGTEKTIVSLDSKKLRRRLINATGQGAMVLSVVGGVDADEVRELSERHIVGKNVRSRAPNDPAPWIQPRAPKQALHSLPKEQSHVVIGFPGTRITNEDRFALEMLIEILGGHGGRLFAGVRDQLGLAYAVSAMSMEGVDPGYIAFYAATAPGQENEVYRAILDEARRIRKQGPTADEVERIKRHLIGSRAIAWQRASVRSASMALDHLYGNGHDESEHYPKRIDAVSRDSLQDVASRYLDLERPIVACVGPDVEKLRFV